MPRPGEAEVMRVVLPSRTESETRWRYDLVRGDRLEAEVRVTVDTAGDKTMFTIVVPDNCPPALPIGVFMELAELVRKFAREEGSL